MRRGPCLPALSLSFNLSAGSNGPTIRLMPGRQCKILSQL